LRTKQSDTLIHHNALFHVYEEQAELTQLPKAEENLGIGCYIARFLDGQYAEAFEVWMLGGAGWQVLSEH